MRRARPFRGIVRAPPDLRAMERVARRSLIRHDHHGGSLYLLPVSDGNTGHRGIHSIPARKRRHGLCIKCWSGTHEKARQPRSPFAFSIRRLRGALNGTGPVLASCPPAQLDYPGGPSHIAAHTTSTYSPRPSTRARRMRHSVNWLGPRPPDHHTQLHVFREARRASALAPHSRAAVRLPLARNSPVGRA
jgi:hypothetical protein